MSDDVLSLWKVFTELMGVGDQPILGACTMVKGTEILLPQNLNPDQLPLLKVDLDTYLIIDVDAIEAVLDYPFRHSVRYRRGTDS
jgi:hypothetical protein